MDTQAADLVTTTALPPTDLLNLLGLVLTVVAVSAAAFVFLTVCWLSARARVERWLSAVVR